MDGRGIYNEKANKKMLELEIAVRRDSQIPEFDSIVDIKILVNDFPEQEALTKFMLQKFETSGLGIFVDDIMKMSDYDFLNEFDSKIDRLNSYPVYILRSLKDAVLDYLKQSEQIDRYRNYASNVICFCRNVTNLDILEAKKIHGFDFETIKKVTGAGSGCGSCIEKVKSLLII